MRGELSRISRWTVKPGRSGAGDCEQRVVDFEPERVARNAFSDRDRELDEEVVE